MSEAFLLACGLVLGTSGAVHLRHLRDTALAVSRHDLLPRRLAFPAAVVLASVELTLATGLVTVSVLGGRDAAIVFATAALVVFLLFGAYLYSVWRHHGGAGLPCACGIGTATVGGWTVTRALMLAGLAGTGALGGAARPLSARPLDELVILLAAAVSVGIAVMALPDARSQPSPTALEGAS